jgi:hypothetical protein
VGKTCSKPASGETASESITDNKIKLLECPEERPLQKQVRIHLTEEARVAPEGWNSSAPSRQLTFHDLKWKPLETAEEKTLQWKRLAKFDDDTWRDIEREEEKRKAESKVHQHELAAKRQQRWRERQRMASLQAANQVQDHCRSINKVSDLLEKRISIKLSENAGAEGLTCRI